MAVNKNFVVKNGLEVNTNLLVADLDTQTVGIGTTIAPHELHVVGGIGVTNLNVTGVATIANLRIGGISTFVGFTTFLGDINVGGALTVSGVTDLNGGLQANTAIVENLTDNRVVIAGSTKNLEDDANFTFTGNQLTLGVGATVGGGLTASTVMVEDLTNNRVVIAGTGGELEDDGNFTFTGNQLTLGVGATVGGGLTASSVMVEDLTNNRVVIAGTDGELEDSSNFVFDGSQLILGVGATVGGALTVAGATDLNGAVDISGETNFSSGVGIADSIFHIGDDNTQIRFPANDTFTVETNGNEAFRITGDQRIGIGTDAPTRLLEVFDSTNALINLKSATQSSVIFSDPADINPGMLIYEHSSDSMQFRVNDAERVRVTSGGDVGIGTITPKGSHAVTASNEAVLAVGIATARKVFSDSLEVGGSQVISDARQLQNIASLDSTTTATIESAIANAPNTFTDIEVTGIATFKSTVKVEDLAPNRVVFVGAGDSLTDDANFTFDRSQLILGVGATVGGALTVAGIATFASAVGIAESIFHIGDPNTSFGFPAADTFTVDTGGGERLRITSSGLIGINENNPGHFIDMNIGTTNIGMKMTSTDPGAYIQFVDNTTSSENSIGALGDNLQFKTDGSERVRITSAGSVGIGTTNPGHNLHIYGSFPDFAISDSDTTNDKFRILHNSGGTQLQVDPNNVSSGSYLLAAIDGSERLRIASDGKLSLTGSAANMEYLRMGGNNDRGLRFTSSSGTSSVGVVHTIDAPGDSGAQGEMALQTNSVERLRITSAGDVDFKGANGITSMSFDRSSNSLDFVDGAKAQFGTGNDLQIYHDGTNTVIGNTTGNLYILDDNAVILGSNSGTESYFKGVKDGAAELYHDNSKKLETTGAGVTVTGICSASGGFDIGIHSAGTSVVSGPVKILNFVGSGNTFAYDASTDTIDISIAGGSGGGGGVTETDTTVSTVNPTGVGSFATASFRSASVITQINQLNTDFQVGRYLMIHDGTTVTVIEESAVSTGSTMLGSFTGVIDGSNVELRVTLASAGVSTITTKIDTVTV